MNCRPLIAFLLCGLLALSPLRAAEEQVSHISPTELSALIQAGTVPVIIDVRSRAEFEGGHVPGAVHVPFWAAWARSGEIPARPDEPLVVYCAHGPRAGFAKLMLRLSGYRRIIYLEGHMSGWNKAGLPLEGVPDQP